MASLKWNEGMRSKRVSSVGHEIPVVTEAGDDGPEYKRWTLESLVTGRHGE